MPRRFELLVFDWDGTLVDSAQAIVEALQGACVDLGVNPPSEERARHIIGLGLKDALRYAVPHVAESDYRSLVDRYRVHFLARDASMRLFPGVLEGLTELQREGYLLAIATGKSRRGLERALDQMNLRRFFVASRCGDEGFSKPHPGMLEAVMGQLGIASGSTLMIGDTTHDLEMACHAGVRSVAVAYGAHPKPQLLAANPEVCLDTARDLFAWLSANA